LTAQPLYMIGRNTGWHSASASSRSSSGRSSASARPQNWHYARLRQTQAGPADFPLIVNFLEGMLLCSPLRHSAVKSAARACPGGRHHCLLPVPAHVDGGLLKLLRVSRVIPLGNTTRVMFSGPGRVFQLTVSSSSSPSLKGLQWAGKYRSPVGWRHVCLCNPLHILWGNRRQVIYIADKPVISGKHSAYPIHEAWL
jgi:hypothetical protein